MKYKAVTVTVVCVCVCCRSLRACCVCWMRRVSLWDHLNSTCIRGSRPSWTPLLPMPFYLLPRMETVTLHQKIRALLLPLHTTPERWATPRPGGWIKTSFVCRATFSGRLLLCRWTMTSQDRWRGIRRLCPKTSCLSSNVRAALREPQAHRHVLM